MSLTLKLLFPGVQLPTGSITLASPGPAPFVKPHRQIPQSACGEDLWREHEISRELFHAAKTHLANAPPRFWFRADGNDWLALGSEGVSVPWYFCRSKPDLLSRLDSLITPNAWRDYFAVAFEVAGQTSMPVNHTGEGHRVVETLSLDFPVSVSATNTPRAALLASAAHSEAGADLLRVNVYLSSPDQLFKRQTAPNFLVWLAHRCFGRRGTYWTVDRLERLSFATTSERNEEQFCLQRVPRIARAYRLRPPPGRQPGKGQNTAARQTG